MFTYLPKQVKKLSLRMVLGELFFALQNKISNLIKRKTNLYEIDRTENEKRNTSPNKTKFNVSLNRCERNTELKYSPHYAFYENDGQVNMKFEYSTDTAETQLHDNDSQVNVKLKFSPDTAEIHFYEK